MKTPLLLGSLLVLFGASSASAQGMDDQTRSQLHKGSMKIWVGTALVTAGALVIPATAANADPSTTELAVGLVAAGAGTWLIWSGFKQRRTAIQPQTDFGFVLGSSRKALVVRRSW